jgi:hypothetical protein
MYTLGVPPQRPYLPERIRFNAPIPPAQRAEIAAVLVPLVDDGFTVSVVVPEAGPDRFGWRVLVDAPGRHASFRVRADATPVEWAEAVRRALYPSS